MNNRKMKVYKNVVVERIHTNLTFPETVPCYANFDYSNPIGVAILRRYFVFLPNFGNVKQSVIMADICLFEDKWTGAWPALGVRFEDETQSNGTVMCLGICGNPNADSRIDPLNDLFAPANILPNPVKCECSTDYAFGCFKTCDRRFTDKKSKTINISDPDFRITPKDTPLEWGSMGFGFPITSPNQWPSPNHTGNEKPIGRYVDGEIVLNDNTLCQCIIPEYLPNEHGDMTCIKCGHYPNPINPFANIL